MTGYMIDIDETIKSPSGVAATINVALAHWGVKNWHASPISSSEYMIGEWHTYPEVLPTLVYKSQGMELWFSVGLQGLRNLSLIPEKTWLEFEVETYGFDFMMEEINVPYSYRHSGEPWSWWMLTQGLSFNQPFKVRFDKPDYGKYPDTSYGPGEYYSIHPWEVIEHGPKFEEDELLTLGWLLDRGAVLVGDNHEVE